MVNEEDLETLDYNEPQKDLFRGESIVEAANKVIDFEALKKDHANGLKKMKTKEFREYKKRKNNPKKDLVKIQKPKKTFLVNEKDLKTIAYNEPEEDLFRRENILKAANKVLDFDKFKKQQEAAIINLNENLLENLETINYVDDIHLDDVKDNKT